MTHGQERLRLCETDDGVRLLAHRLARFASPDGCGHDQLGRLPPPHRSQRGTHGGAGRQAVVDAAALVTKVGDDGFGSYVRRDDVSRLAVVADARFGDSVTLPAVRPDIFRSGA